MNIMTEKINHVKKPLTIIAIFAGIAEVSGTIITPFIDKELQGIFIYFLIGFPTILVVLFFVTLWFKSNVLYAPSDFSNEENYVIMRQFYDKNRKIEIVERKQSNTKKTDGTCFVAISSTNAPQKANSENSVRIRLADVPTASNMAKAFRKKGYNNIDIYSGFSEEPSTDENSKAIWIGADIDIETIKKVIKDAVRIYPNLKYISISNEYTDNVRNEIFIGGSTETAISRNAKDLEEEDFKAIESVKNINELEQIITQKFY